MQGLHCAQCVKIKKMAKLSQQIQSQQNNQTEQRPTRSQRVQSQLEAERFENLKQQAKQIQDTQFKDKVVTKQETYYEYRPAKYSEKEWSRMRDRDKQSILREYERARGFEYYANRGELVRIPKTRTVTQTIPFTLDEGENSYENIYAGLSPELQQFFSSPETLKTERTQRIQQTTTKSQERISMAKMRLVELEQKYQKEKQDLQEWWQKKSSQYRSDPRNRENYKERQRDIENDYDEDKQEQRGVIEGFSKGIGELSTGKEVDYGAIESYAVDLANFYEDKERSRNDRKEAERKEVKALEERNKKAQEAGFNMTGVITQSYVDPKTKKETVQGVKYYIGGAQVSPQDFSKKFDVYQKPTGKTFFTEKGIGDVYINKSGQPVILAKGTDLSKLSDAQVKTLFPTEYAEAEAQAKTQQLQKAQDFEKNVEGLPVAEQPEPEVKKPWYKKTLNVVGDALSGIFLKSTIGTGTRGFVSGEPTALTGEELEIKRQEALDQTIIAGFTRGELVNGKEAPIKKKSIFNTGIFDLFGIRSGFDLTGTQVAGYKLSKEIRESGEKTILQQQLDVTNIEGGVGRLQTINEQMSNFGKQAEEGKIDPALAQTKIGELETQRLTLFKELSSKGIKTTVETDDEGLQTLTFSSKALETDLAPASVKLLRQASPTEKGFLITGGLASEALEFGVIGLVTGGTGASAKVGLFATKLPKALKIAGGLGLVSLYGTGLYKSGKSGFEKGEDAGLGKYGGLALGLAVPVTQTVAFAGGTFVGNKFYTQRIISKIEKGGFTKPAQEKLVIDGKEVKYPAQVRAGKTEFNAQGDVTRAVQGDKLITKIPGTDIKIETSGRIKGTFVGRDGRSLGESVSTITGKQAGAYAGQKTLSRALYFDKEGQTAIVSFTKTPKGVRVDQFLTGTKSNNFKVLEETAQGGKTVFIDFNRYVARVGDPIYAKGAGLSDASIKATFNRFIGTDTLFTPIDDLSSYSIGRTQQIISISPKLPKGATYNLGGGSIKVLSETDKFQTFASVGSSRIARTDALKDLINQITKQEGGFAVFSKNFLMNKKGRVSLPSFTSPSSVTTSPTTIKIPSSIFAQDQIVTVSPLTSELESTIRSALSTNSLLGTGTIAGFASITKFGQRGRQNLSQRILQMQLQNLTQMQIQTPIQQQNQQQQQQQAQQSLQQQLQQEQFQIPQIPGVTTPVTPTITPGFPGLPDFDLQFFEDVKKKAGRKKQKKDLAYVQDFTSKIVGFAPVRVSESQAMKLAMKTQTGFEIRAPIIVTKNNKDTRRLKKLLAQ